MIANSRRPSGLDRVIAEIIETRGLKVDFVDDNDLARVNISAPQMVWVAESVNSKLVGKFFTRDRRPVVVCESFLYDDMLMTGQEPLADYGFDDGTQIQFVDDVGNVTSTDTLYSYASPVNWGVVKSNARVIARDPRVRNHAYVFAYPPNAIGPGVGTRVGCPIYSGGGSASNIIAEYEQAAGKAIVNRLVDLAFRPAEPIISLVVNRPSITFTAVNQQTTLRVGATDQFGNNIGIDMLDIEWVTTRPAAVSIVGTPDDTVTIQTKTSMGYSIIVARSRAKPGLVSPPVSVTSVTLKPKVAPISDNDIIYPIPQLLPDETLTDVDGYSIVGNDLTVGGFPLLSVLERYRVTPASKNGKRGVPVTRTPVVMRTSAISRRTKFIVCTGNQKISGRIVSRKKKKEWTLLTIQSVVPTALYKEYSFEFDGEALVAAGLYSNSLPAGDSSRIINAFKKGPPSYNRMGDTYNPMEDLRQVKLFEKTPKGLGRFNKEACARGDLNFVKLDLGQPSVKPSLVTPRGGIRILGGRKTYFFFYGGVKLEAGIRPEFDAQPNVNIEIDCALGPKIPILFGLTAITASTFDLVLNLELRYRAKLKAAAGPRLNGFVLAQGRIVSTFGLRFEDGRLWTSDSDTGDYIKFDPNLDIDKGLTANIGNPFGTQVDNDAFIEGSFGFAMNGNIEAQLGGAILAGLDEFIGAAQRTDRTLDAALNALDDFGVLPVLEKLGFDSDVAADNALSAGLGALNFITGLTNLVFLEFGVPIEASYRFETARRILNEADAGEWLADEHQRFGVQLAPSVEIGFVEIEKFLKTLFGVTVSLAVKVEPPPTELGFFHKSVQPDGNIQSRIIKGSDNEKPKFEVGDRIFVRVPGVYGLYTGLDLTRQKYVTPQRGSVYTESVTAFTEVAELDYRGIQAGLHIFDGYVEIKDASLAAYLNDNKELFFLGWNRFTLSERFTPWNIAGYLNSAKDFPFTGVNLQAPMMTSLSAELDETATGGIDVINQSTDNLEPVEITFTVTTDIRGLKITPKSGSMSPNANTPLKLEYKCKRERTFEGLVTIAGEIPDMDPKVEGKIEVKVKVECVDVDCPLGAIPNPGGATECACDSYNGWIVVPNTNTCKCDTNRGFQFVASTSTCSSCRDRDATKPYYNTETRQCEDCPFGAIVNPTGVTPCACDSSRGFFIVAADSMNPDTCECAAEKPKYNGGSDNCEECPGGLPKYNPTTGLCEKDCTDAAMPFFNPATSNCEACPPATPKYNSDIGVCEAACPGGSGSGNDKPFFGSFELGTPSGVFSFRRQHFRVKDRMQVLYEGRVLHDTGCTGGGENIRLSYAGSSTNVLVRVIPNCAGTTGTAWNFAVSCPG